MPKAQPQKKTVAKKTPTKKTTTKKMPSEKPIKMKVLNAHATKKPEHSMTIQDVEHNVVKYLRLIGGVVAILGGLYLLADIALGLVLITVGTIALSNFMNTK